MQPAVGGSVRSAYRMLGHEEGSTLQEVIGASVPCAQLATAEEALGISKDKPCVLAAGGAQDNVQSQFVCSVRVYRGGLVPGITA